MNAEGKKMDVRGVRYIHLLYDCTCLCAKMALSMSHYGAGGAASRTFVDVNHAPCFPSWSGPIVGMLGTKLTCSRPATNSGWPERLNKVAQPLLKYTKPRLHGSE